MWGAWLPRCSRDWAKRPLGPRLQGQLRQHGSSCKLRSSDSCSSEWAGLHTHCEGSLRIWLWVTPIFQYDISPKIGWRGWKLHDETHSFWKTQTKQKKVSIQLCHPWAMSSKAHNLTKYAAFSSIDNLAKWNPPCSIEMLERHKVPSTIVNWITCLKNMCF